ncbi:hypothetical protein [Solirubrum puertoriconensis]|uniref:Uncharacterized protein n=1 Tax=Solirubrum puertoriconensis TaxID=1751427 RepID=A0A9X0L6M2_SOLP1|nr:hypothetical protein [Solirubrum puertoriconensis]KUG09932.1 hypothetical protein ASU33_20495 [Solirubrum puertoriconensis]
MTLRLRLPYVVAFLLCTLVFTELHELAHLTVAGLVCGCYGPRDFNVWETCVQCSNPELGFLASAAGPLFSYAMMWLGMWGLRSANPVRRGLGLTLLFANLPFARLLTVAMGGGDELTLVRALAGSSEAYALYRGIATAVVFALGGIPLIVALRRIGNRRAWLWVAGLCVAPLLFEFGYLFQLMNGLLERGTLADVWFMGTPGLIWVHSLLALMLLLLMLPYLPSIDANVTISKGTQLITESEAAPVAVRA